MKDRSVIQKFIAGAMLLLFTLSITPKQYLHDLLADHTDTYSVSLNGEASVSQQAMNCGFDDLVVSSPFIEASFENYFFKHTFHNEFFSSHYCFIFSQTTWVSDLRGPPAVS